MGLDIKQKVLVVKMVAASVMYSVKRSVGVLFAKFYGAAFTILVLAFAGGAIAFVSWLFCKRFLRDENIPLVEFKHTELIQYWGQLGDFFGGILNPILSFCCDPIGSLYN